MNETKELAWYSRAEKFEIHQIYFDGYRALDEIHGQNHPAVILAPQKNAHCTLERP
jgi:hypothetical protein